MSATLAAHSTTHAGPIISTHPALPHPSPPFVLPRLPEPSRTTSVPATSEQVARNEEILRSYVPSAVRKLVDLLDILSNSSMKIAGHPLFWLGSALLVYGTGSAFFVLITTRSIDKLLVSPALGAILLGGLFRDLGESMRKGENLSTALGNMLYMPLRYLVKLAS